MSDRDGTVEFSWNPDLSLDAELLGATTAADIADGLAELTEADTGNPVLPEVVEEIRNLLGPGIAHFYDLAREAGEMAGTGDPIGAISLLGGIKNAVDMIGVKDIEEMLTDHGLTLEDFGYKKD